MRLRLIAAAAASIMVAGLAPAAGSPSNPGFLVGFDDDLPKTSGSAGVTPATTVGAGAFRFTLGWSSGETALTAADRAGLGTAVSAASGFRIVLTVFGTAGSDAPIDAAGRSAYCSFVADALRRYPSIRDVVIWNEPNKRLFWNAAGTGQADAPAQYEALLATCYDSLHSAFASVNVIGLALSSTGSDNATSTSPGAFIRELGDAYRASGRSAPLMDTVGFHPYPVSSSERPWVQHIGEKTIAQGDWNKLMYNLWLAFDGSAQPLPGSGGVTIWYLEDGFQTTVPSAKAGAYSGTENVATIPDSAGTTVIDQATQVLDAIRRAACQPNVGAFFNFMLVDDPALTGWQSGAFWADGTAKGSLGAFQRATSEARAGTVDCSALQGGTPSSDFMPPSAPATPTAQTQTIPLTVTLSWTAASDDSGAPTTYRIYRNGTWTGTATALTWTDSSADDAATYSYTVRALDRAGNLGNASPPLSVTTPDVTPPSTPGSFGAAVAGPTAVALSWTASTDNAGVSSYELSRDGAVLASVSGTGYTDNGVAAGSSHTYSITAVDTAGNRSAAATAQVTLPPPAAPVNTVVPVVGGSALKGQTLTVATGSWSSATTPAFAYQWQRCDSAGAACVAIAGSTAGSYLIGSGDVGSTLRAVVTATNPGGSTSATSAATAIVTDTPVAPPSAPSNTVLPVVGGSAQKGQTLTVSPGTWSSATTPAYAYQWQRCNSACVAIAGATTNTYLVVAADVGATLRAVVTATNAGGATSATSAATAVVTDMPVTPPAAPVNTVLPAVGGTAQQGQTLTVSTGTWSSATTPAFAYQWQRCNSACVAIAGSTTNSYLVTTTDVGSTLRAVVTATNAGGSTSATSTATAVVTDTPATPPVPPAAPVNTVLPVVGGSGQKGQTLTVSTGSWSSTTTPAFAYQWQRCDAACVAIAGATANSYLVVAADVASTLRAVVTATNAGGSTSATSAATAVVTDLPVTPVPAPVNTVLPVVGGSARKGQTLTVSTGTWSSTTTPAYVYQWQRCDSACVAIAGATANSYLVSAADVGSTLRAVVTATNTGGSTSATSTATAVVTDTPVTPPTPAAAGGGGGGGGGGSNSIGLTVTPSAQTIASGSTATLTISVTNTGGAYLYAVGVSGPAPGCAIPATFSDTAGFMAPGVTISYGCSLAGVTSSFTNTVTASATTGPGPVITTTATAAVTVQAAPLPSPAPAIAVERRPAAATITVAGVSPVRLDAAKPKLSLTIAVPSRTTLVLALLDARGRKLAGWVKRTDAGTHRLALVLPPSARKPGRDRLRITATGAATRTLPVRVLAAT